MASPYRLHARSTLTDSDQSARRNNAPPSPSPSSSSLLPPSDKRRRIVVGSGVVSKRISTFSPTLEEDESGASGSSGGKLERTELPRSGSAESSNSQSGSIRGASPAIRRKAALYEKPGEGTSREQPLWSTTQGKTLPLRVVNRSGHSSLVSTSAPNPSVDQPPSRPFQPPPPLALDQSSSSSASDRNLSSSYTTPNTSPTKSAYQHDQQQPFNRTPLKGGAGNVFPPPLATFSSSRVPTLGSPSATPTTKDLISRFESPRIPPPSPSSRQTPNRAALHLDKPLPPLQRRPTSPLDIPTPSFHHPSSPYKHGSSNYHGSSPRSPGKSPLRDGFKKLVGKFGKGRRKRKGSRGDMSCSGEDDDEGELAWRPEPEKRLPAIVAKEEPMRRYDEMLAIEAGKREPVDLTGGASRPSVDGPKRSLPPTAPLSHTTHTAIPLRSSALYYLLPSSSPLYPATWIHSLATLHPGQLLLAPPPDSPSSSTRVISLSGCDSVRSVPEREALERWGSPLEYEGEDEDGNGGEVHYLELGFSRGEEEGVVIGVLSVGERLGWVSSIWDGILSSNPLSPPQIEQSSTFSKPLPLIASAAMVNTDDAASRSPLPTSTQPPEESPHDSILQTPPSGPLSSLPPSDHDHHRSTYMLPDEVVFPSTSGSSSPPYTVSSRSHRPTHFRQVSSDHAPRLSRPKLGGTDDLRLSVERMFGGRAGSSHGHSPYGSEEVEEVLSAAAPSLERAERMEDPSALPDFSTLTLNNLSTSLPRSNSFESNGFDPDPSDLNPSRSASQIHHRRQPEAYDAKDEGDSTPLSYAERRAAREGGQMIGGHRESSIEELASLREPSAVSQSFPYDQQHQPLPSSPQQQLDSQLSPSSAGGNLPYLAEPSSLSQTLPLSISEPPSQLPPPSQPASATEETTKAIDAKLSTVQQGIAFLVSDRSAEADRLTRFEDGLNGIGLDLKEVVEVLRSKPLSSEDEEVGEEGKAKESALLVEVNGKLDRVLEMFEKMGVQQQQRSSVVVGDVEHGGEGEKNLVASAPSFEGEDGRVSPGTVKSEADVFVDAPTDPRPPSALAVVASARACSNDPSSPPGPPAELLELLDLVKEQRSHRTAQTAQTSEIARYLHELNAWIESFTAASSKNLNDVTSKIDQLTDIVAPSPLATDEDVEVLTATPLPGTEGHGGRVAGGGGYGVVGMLEDVKGMMGELLRERGQGEEGEVAVAARARMENALAGLDMKAGQQGSSVENVLALLERSRLENQTLLTAVVSDLRTEIQGERLRFVDAMSKATSLNIERHVAEFKGILSQEVRRSQQELVSIREQKQTLEREIAALFKFKVENGGIMSSPRRPSAQSMPSHPGPPPSGPPPPIPSPNLLPPQHQYQHPR